MEYTPYKDFGGIIKSIDISQDDKLVRTFLHHMIDGIEYMHSEGYAHMDIKPKNMVLGSDFFLKFIDFDFVTKLRLNNIEGKGTSNYRAPELK